MPLDQLLERDAHLLFDIARRVDVAGEAVDLGAGILRSADAREPSGAAAQYRRHHRDGLDIVDRGRAAVEPDLRRKGRFQPRLALAAFKAFEQASLLAANIGARAAV